MAQFDNVNYTYYSSTLGRAVIPTEADFNRFKLENVQLMKTWLDYVEEREENGIDNAVCLMIEVAYEDSQLLTGNDERAINSESVDGHSVSYNSTARNKLEELNAECTLRRKMEKANLFVSFNTGVR